MASALRYIHVWLYCSIVLWSLVICKEWKTVNMNAFLFLLSLSSFFFPSPLPPCLIFSLPPFPPNFSECEGLTTNEAVDDSTIDRFSGCNIITTGGIRIGSIGESNFKWVVSTCSGVLACVYGIFQCHTFESHSSASPFLSFQRLSSRTTVYHHRDTRTPENSRMARSDISLPP